jgi:hypothetical protein
LDAQPAGSLYLCTPVLAELRYGIERLPHGRRRDRLTAWVDRLEREIYRGQILGLDPAAAAAFGRLAATRERLGRRMEAMDGLIAGIAASQGAIIATRDTSDFEHLGIELINPFDAPIPR